MERKLSTERAGAARRFLEEVGRPLDLALLRHRLGEIPAEAALQTLEPFQNSDGGFGRGLEPDIQSPASSAIATSIGLRLLARLGAGRSQPMVVGAVGWLARTLDEGRGVWPIIDPGVDEAPHAPWWTWSDDLAAAWNGFNFNPTAEILALLYRWREAVPPTLLGAAEAGMRRTLAGTALIDGAYDIKCAVRLAEATGAPTDIAGPLGDLVRRSVAAHDPADEHISVLDIAPTPTSPFAASLAERLDRALDALANSQSDDGGWSPFWDWSFIDAEAWARAKAAWRGQLTREALETLAAWGRVA